MLTRLLKLFLPVTLTRISAVINVVILLIYYLSIIFIPQFFCPTRVTEHSSTIIDNLLINTHFEWISGILNTDLTDHFMIIISIKLPVSLSYHPKTYTHKQFDMPTFVRDVANLS